MKLVTQKENTLSNIISLPNSDTDFALLEEITETDYVYNITYFVDVNAAAKKNAYLVRISFCKDSPVVNEFSIFQNINSSKESRDNISLVSNILHQEAGNKDIAKNKARKEPYFVHISDITKKIPNNKTSYLSNGNLVISKRYLKAMKIKDLASANINMPIVFTKIEDAQRETDKNSKDISIDLLFKKNIDPASIGNKNRTFVSSEKVFGGRIETQKIVSDKEKELFHSIFWNDTETRKENSDGFSGEEIAVIPAQEEQRIIEIAETVVIPKASLQTNNVYVTLELFGADNDVKETKYKLLNHGRNLELCSIPTTPPVVQATKLQTSGRVILLIKQTDSRAKGFAIYRKKVSTTSKIGNSSYLLLETIKNHSVADGEYLFSDATTFSSPVIYRVVPFGNSGVYSGEFSSIVVGGMSNTFSTKPIETKINFISFSYEIKENGIKIFVLNVPRGLVAVQLHRYNLTTKEQEPTQIENTYYLNNTLDPGNITFFDRDVAEERLYKYVCKMIYREGFEEWSSSVLHVFFTKEISNIAQTAIKNIHTKQEGSNLDTTFDLETSFVMNDEDMVRDTLNKMGLESYFSDAITKEKLQNIVAYGITRNNLTTGEFVNFGITTKTSFSDYQLGLSKNLPKVQEDCEYEYEVTTYFRDILSTLESYEKQVTYDSAPNKNYSYQPFIWENPVTLKYGNIITADTLKKNYAFDVFDLGYVCHRAKAKTSTMKTNPFVFEAIANKITKKSILIRWKLQGDTKKVDHFILAMELLGERMPIGKCHNFSSTGLFEYIDVLDDGEKGLIKYLVIPIYSDYSKGKEEKTNEILV